MKIIMIINILIFFILSIIGLIYLLKKRKIAEKTIQIKINFRTMSIFSVMFVLGAILMAIIFIVNLKFELITVVSKQNFILLLKNIPNEFITAFGEELFLRVLVFVGILSLINNKIIALLLCSLIFCFLHSPDTHVNFISYFLAGLMYGISYLKFKTVWAPTGLHFAWNYFQGVVFGFPVGNQISNGYFVINVIDSKVWNGGDYGPEGSILGIFARILIILIILVITHIVKKYLNAPDFLKIEK